MLMRFVFDNRHTYVFFVVLFTDALPFAAIAVALIGIASALLVSIAPIRNVLFAITG